MRDATLNPSEPQMTQDALQWKMTDIVHHHESHALVKATPEAVFAFVDDHARLSSHMSKSSWMMGGGRMRVETDEGKGQKVGSRIRMAGKVFGITLVAEEVVTEHVPPQGKIWKTVGRPRLLVIGHYRMGFRITAESAGTQLRVFIDYTLPDTLLGRGFGFLFGRYYAAWCTKRMADDAARHFDAALLTTSHN